MKSIVVFGIYLVFTTNVFGVNLVTNGDFESGNTGFSTQYTFAGTCGGVSGEGIYTIADRNCYGPGVGGPSGAGLLYFANGAVNTNQFVWRQDLNTAAGTRYFFRAFAASGVSLAPPVLTIQTAQVACATAAAGDFTSIGTITATTTIWEWVQSNGFFNSTSNATCLRLLNNNAAAQGNDYGLDDIFVDSVYSVTSNVAVAGAGTVSCTAAQPLPGGQPNEVLNGGDATCSVTTNPGFTFTGWTGNCSGNADACNLTNISTNQAVVANFAAAGTPGNISSVPTLSEWAMIFLAAILALFGVARVRSASRK